MDFLPVFGTVGQNEGYLHLAVCEGEMSEIIWHRCFRERTASMCLKDVFKMFGMG